MADRESENGGVMTLEKRFTSEPDLLYALGQDFFHELDSHGFIGRLSKIPHLGLIEVPQGFSKTRLDYINMQLIFHRIVKKSIRLPEDRMKIGYNTPVKAKLLGIKLKGDDPSVADCLQIMCFATNVGHAYHTFVSSRAIAMASMRNDIFRDRLLASCPSSPIRTLAARILEENNYHQVHLINALLVLAHCDQRKDSVKIAQAMLKAYLDEKSLPEDDKRKAIIKLFRTVRDVSFLPNDLQVASIPLTIDLEDEVAIGVLFKELLCTYNNNTQPRRLIEALKKLLNDYVYNVDSSCIRHYRIAQNISKHLIESAKDPGFDYYQDIWLDPGSCLNKRPAFTMPYDEDTILKLTFDPGERTEAMALLHELEKKSYVRVGYYDRYRQTKDGVTLLISQVKGEVTHVETAFFLMKKVLDYLLKLEQAPNHSNYLLTAKYFLHHLFNRRSIEILTPVDPKRSVLCTPNLKGQREALDTMLKKNLGSETQRHEVEFLKTRLEDDFKDDVILTIPSSILAYGPDKKTDCEFDGLIIYPNRSEEQVIFLEAKLMKSKSTKAKTDLHAKLKDLGFDIPLDHLILVGNDCYYPMTIG